MSARTEDTDTGTLSQDVEGGAFGDATESFLFVVFNSDDPWGPSSRHALTDIDEVHLRRGSTRTSVRVTDAGNRQLLLTIPDRWMSGMHAHLKRHGSEWWVEDAGSKNGTLIDGKRISRARLSAAMVLEVGHTFLLFRDGVASYRELPRDALLEASDLPAPLSTLSPGLGRTFELLTEIAPSSIPVLVRGETGTGKENVSRALHGTSARRGPFVAVNCGAFPPALIEAELFGFRKGSFSGATEDRIGLVRSADTGTLLLDEIGDLPLPAQTALLRVLQEGQVVPIGAVSPVNVDFRLVSATHRDLEKRAENGEFREDLLARLAGFCVRLPSLRDRREDIGLLVGELLNDAGALDSVSFSVPAARMLFNHPWSHNIRELKRRLKLGVLLAKGNPIGVEHLFASDPESSARDPSSGQSGPPQRETSAALPLDAEDRARRDELVALLREHGGNVTAVARVMGKARVQVQRWIRRYGLNRREPV